MRKYKLDLLRREFSFLEKLDVNPEKVSKVLVKKGDKNLLDQTGRSVRYGEGYVHQTYEYTKYFAVSGTEVTELQWNWEYSGRNSESGSADTNGEQLFALRMVPDYIVESIREDRHGQGAGEDRYEWTIYKMKDFNLLTYHQKNIDQAASTLKAEIEAACNTP